MIISYCTFVFLHFLSWLLLLSRWSMVSWKSASSWRKGMSRLLNYFCYSETTRICFFTPFLTFAQFSKKWGGKQTLRGDFKGQHVNRWESCAVTSLKNEMGEACIVIALSRKQIVESLKQIGMNSELISLL